MKATQLEIFGMSADENHFTSTLWGVLTFFPASSNKWKDTCRHCLLFTEKEIRDFYKKNEVPVRVDTRHHDMKDIEFDEYEEVK